MATRGRLLTISKNPRRYVPFMADSSGPWRTWGNRICIHQSENFPRASRKVAIVGAYFEEGLIMSYQLPWPSFSDENRRRGVWSGLSGPIYTTYVLLRLILDLFVLFQHESEVIVGSSPFFLSNATPSLRLCLARRLPTPL